MNKDRLLSELGDLARQEEEAEKARLDERWDRLAAGTLTAEEEAELKALAESSPEIREAYEAFRPLGADFQARMVSAIHAEWATPAPQPVPPDPRPLPFRRAVRRIEVWLGAAVAVAASLFLLVHGPALPPLPAYSVDPLSGDKASRGGESVPPGGLPVFSPGSMLELKVRPQPPSRIQGPLEARAFRVPVGGAGVDWVPEPGFAVENGADGTVRLRGTLGETTQLPPGMWKICVVVSRPGKAPDERELPAALGSEHAGWQAACTQPLRIEGRPST
jgi:hypothetical protein